MHGLLFTFLSVIMVVASSPLPTDIISNEPISNLDLIIPLLLKKETQVGKKPIHPDQFRSQVEISLQDTAFSNIPASAFVLDNSKRSQSDADNAWTFTKDNPSRLVDKPLTRSKTERVNSKKQEDPYVKLLLIQKCLNKMQQNSVNKLNKSSLEIILYLCKELADSFIHSEDIVEITGLKQLANDEGPEFILLAEDIKDKIDKKAVEVVKNKETDGDCKNCCQVFVYEENDEDENEDIEKLLKKKLNLDHSPIVVAGSPYGWFGEQKS